MKIGIIGAGAIGGTLAGHLTKRGHQVLLANSRGPETLAEISSATGATAVDVRDAVKGVDVVIVSIPQKAVLDLPRDLFAGVPAPVVVIDTGNYYPELRDGRIDALESGTPDSVWVAQQLGRPVVKAFNNIIAPSLAGKAAPSGTPGRVALSVAGDAHGKAVTLRLLDEIGFDGVDGGNLEDSWRQQPGTPAYCKDMGAAALTKALAEAERSRVREYLAESEAWVRERIAQRAATSAQS